MIQRKTFETFETSAYAVLLSVSHETSVELMDGEQSKAMRV